VLVGSLASMTLGKRGVETTPFVLESIDDNCLGAGAYGNSTTYSSRIAARNRLITMHSSVVSKPTTGRRRANPDRPRRCIMKIFICSLLLSCLVTSSATGGNSKEMLWDRLILCSQVTIEHPYPAIFRVLTDVQDLTEHCCRLGNRIRDCHMYDWYEKHGSRELRLTRTAAEATNSSRLQKSMTT
jgi:hypothetical protein